jgi:hypothetical protein
VAKLIASISRISLSSSTSRCSSSRALSSEEASFVATGFSRTELSKLPRRQNFICREYAVEAAFKHISSTFGEEETRASICTVLGCPGSGKTEFFAQIMHASHTNTLSGLCKAEFIEFDADETICLAITLNCATPLVIDKELEYRLIEIVLLRLFFIWFTDEISFCKFIYDHDLQQILQLPLKLLLNAILERSGKKRCILLIDEPIKLLQNHGKLDRFISGVTELAAEQNRHLAIVFSSLLLNPFMQEASGSNRRIIKVPMNLLDLQEVSQRLLPELAPRLSDCIRNQCTNAGHGDPYMAIASIIGGFPRLLEFAATKIKKDGNTQIGLLLHRIFKSYRSTADISTSLDCLTFSLVSSFFHGNGNSYTMNKEGSRVADSLVLAGWLSRQFNDEDSDYLVIPQFVLMIYCHEFDGTHCEREIQLKHALQYMFEAVVSNCTGKPWEHLCLSVDRIKRAVRPECDGRDSISLLQLYQHVYATSSFCGHTLCADIAEQKFIVGNLLTEVKEFSDRTDFRSFSVSELTSAVWYPGSDSNAGFDYAILYEPVTGALSLSDLVVVVTECKFSEESSTTVLQWSTVVEKRKNAVVNVKRTFGIDEDKIVFRVAPWRNLTHPHVATLQSLPKNIIVHGKDGLSSLMAPTLTLAVKNLGILTA